MNYCGIVYTDLANGTGVRTTLYVSGCTHHCEGCFNSETWDFNYGRKFTDKVKDAIFDAMDDNHKGLTLLGGEPLELYNIETLLPFLKEFKERFPNKDVWCYTGYTYDHVKDYEILKYIDILIDGEFDIHNRSYVLPFRGSYNQRIIDVKQSIKENRVVEYEIC